MIEWWNSLMLAQQIFALMGIGATVALIVQTVMLLFGFGDDGDADVGGMGEGDGLEGGLGDVGDGLVIFSIKGIVAMLAMMGWTGVLFLGLGMNHALAILLALLCGALTLVAMAYAMRAISKLQSSGNIDVGNAIGKVGQVYIPIKPGGNAQGKVNITVQGKFTEFSAITTADHVLPTGSYVRVVAVDEAGTLLVEPLSKNES